MSKNEPAKAIAILGRRRQWQQAVALMEELQREGEPPSSTALSAAIGACGKGLQWQRALELLDDIRRSGETPHIVSYNAAVGACSRSRQLVRALQLVEDMRRQKIGPNSITRAQVLKACQDLPSALDGGEALAAQALLAEARAGSGSGGASSSSAAPSRGAGHGAPAVQATGFPLAGSGGPSSSSCPREHRDFLVQRPMHCESADPYVPPPRPPLPSFSTSPPARSEPRARQAQDAQTFYQQICGSEATGAWQQAISLIEQMQGQGLVPWLEAYIVAMAACEDAGQWQQALTLLGQLRNRSPCPRLLQALRHSPLRESLCEVAMRCLAEGDLWQGALALVQEMRSEGMFVSEEILDLAISACIAGGMWNEVWTLVEN
eukprot:TRINITY_DN92642_c0_g1_i1.p1 TRINITY_DN92642_c0_g1~~TRINITY_DN92642_c0_g1_i1.p1  ORF type:complete len:377 (+),score=76.37 TRINITY_DN92642_c0_g1_i1:114-1244(+)